MSIDHPVPFFANTSDDLHCYEASLRMILKFFQPDREYSWEEMETITGKKEGLWTWPQQGMLWFQEHGFDVVNIETFDYPRFVETGVNYLFELYGEEGAKEQLAHCDIPAEIEICKQFYKEVKTELRLPTWNDIKHLLEKGYLLGCLINSAALNNISGYVGHFVVIKGITDSTLILHDPGLPPQENRIVTYQTFERAWANPDENTKNIAAFKLKNE